MSHASRSPSPRTAFSLIELLVVITIIAILFSMLSVSVGMVRTAARGVVCGSHLRQVTMALTAYRGDNESYFPPLALSTSMSDWITARATGRWQNLLQDFLGTYAVLNCQAARMAKPSNGYSYGVRDQAEGWIQRGDAAAGTVCLMAYNLNDWGRYPSTVGQAWTPSNPGPVTEVKVQARISAALPGVNSNRCPLLFDGLWSNTGTAQYDNREGTFFPHNLRANLSFSDGHVETHDRNAFTSWGDWATYPTIVAE